MSDKRLSAMTNKERMAFFKKALQDEAARSPDDRLRDMIENGTIDENGKVLLYTQEDMAHGVEPPDRSPTAIAERLRRFDERTREEQHGEAFPAPITIAADHVRHGTEP